jgi:hypothetical protein
MIGIIVDPKAAQAAILEPESAPKIVLPIITTTPKAPGIHLSQERRILTSTSAMPLRLKHSPIRMKSGNAMKRKFEMFEKQSKTRSSLYCGPTIRRIDKRLASPNAKATGIPITKKMNNIPNIDIKGIQSNSQILSWEIKPNW